MKIAAVQLVLILAWLFACLVPAGASDRLRVIIETDAGGDPDDEQSLVRFLLYANEWDVEGIIANRPAARPGENRNTVRTGLGIVQRHLDACGAVHARLSENAPGYPTKEHLWARTVSGYADSDAGVELILAAVDRDDPRPVWFQNWGTDHGSDPSNLKRDNVLKRWAADLQNDFRARMDWCVKPFAEANHPPVAVVNGSRTREVLTVEATPGVTVELDASASQDPDGALLSFEWFVYPEAGSFTGRVELRHEDSPRAFITLPPNAAGKSVHVILAVRDGGNPPLAAFRRVILEGKAGWPRNSPSAGSP